MIKTGFLGLLLLCITINLYSRPRSGVYYIEGVLLSLDGRTMKSEKVIYGNDTLVTDSSGKFTIKITWVYDDCRGYKKKKCNNLINGTHVFIIARGKHIYIKNKWRKYGLKRKGNSKYKIKVVTPLVYLK